MLPAVLPRSAAAECVGSRWPSRGSCAACRVLEQSRAFERPCSSRRLDRLASPLFGGRPHSSQPTHIPVTKQPLRQQRPLGSWVWLGCCAKACSAYSFVEIPRRSERVRFVVRRRASESSSQSLCRLTLRPRDDARLTLCLGPRPRAASVAGERKGAFGAAAGLTALRAAAAKHVSVRVQHGQRVSGARLGRIALLPRLLPHAHGLQPPHRIRRRPSVALPFRHETYRLGGGGGRRKQPVTAHELQSHCRPQLSQEVTAPEAVGPEVFAERLEGHWTAAMACSRARFGSSAYIGPPAQLCAMPGPWASTRVGRRAADHGGGVERSEAVRRTSCLRVSSPIHPAAHRCTLRVSPRRRRECSQAMIAPGVPASTAKTTPAAA
jgi:hypothetical protein